MLPFENENKSTFFPLLYSTLKTFLLGQQKAIQEEEEKFFIFQSSTLEFENFFILFLFIIQIVSH